MANHNNNGFKQPWSAAASTSIWFVVMILLLVMGGATSTRSNRKASSEGVQQPSSSSQSSLITFPIIPYQELVRRRRRELSSSSSVVLDETVLYKGLGTHFIDLYCGSPTPQRRTVTIDTGSGYVAFPCTGCNQCGNNHIDQPYDPSQSTAFSSISCSACQIGTCSSSSSQQCLYDAKYLEGDGWEAYEAADLCFAGDPSSSSSSLAFSLNFGCQTQVTGFFISQLEDGIMGMDYSATSFWYQMFKAGKINQAMFSLCYTPTLYLASISQGSGFSEAGVLVLGGTDTRLHNSTMVYSSSAISTSDPFFHVNVRNIYLQPSSSSGSSSNNVITLSLTSSELAPSGGTIIDSGTTYSILFKDWQDPFLQAWSQMVGTNFFQTLVTLDQLSALPTILFQFQGDSTANARINTTASSSVSPGVTLAASLDPQHPQDIIVAVPPTHYMQYNVTEQLYGPVLSFLSADSSILGANIMMEYDILFDAENQRLGWASSQCSYSQLTGSSGGGSTTLTTNGTSSGGGPITFATPTKAPSGGGFGGLGNLFSAAAASQSTTSCTWIAITIFYVVASWSWLVVVE